MEKKTISLETRENNKITRIFQIIFGIACISIAVFWIIYNYRSVKADRTLWITVAFLTGFGAFQIFSGLGFAARYIEFGTDNIRLKNNSLLSPVDLSVSNVERIEIFPLKALIFLKSAKKILIRFGVTDIEKVELIKDEIMTFASANNIGLELKNEQLL
jgi:hypothetical protein